MFAGATDSCSSRGASISRYPIERRYRIVSKSHHGG
jgi:hypothetical protein